MDTKQANAAVKMLRDLGIIPEETAAALLPAPRRKAALCRNHRGSAYAEHGPCSAPVYRVYELQYDGKWKLAHNLCAKCLPVEAEYMDAETYRVKPV